MYWIYIFDVYQRLCNTKVYKSFRGGGRYTLGIFVIQFVVIEQIGKMFFKIHNIPTHMIPWFDYVLTPIMGCIALLICYVLVRLLCKIKIINLFFFGNQYL